MEIDFKKYDEISRIEKVLGTLLKHINLSEYQLSILNNENQILLILTIITILYKEHTYNEYLIEQLDDEHQHIIKTTTHYNYFIEDIIEELEYCIDFKELEKANQIINSNGIAIQQILGCYYERKKTNYIFSRIPIELIIKNQQVFELIELNPFAANQCIDYQPITQEEKIICNIIQYYEICGEKDYISIKRLIIKNYQNKQLKKVILFILNNVYQELLEDKTETDIGEIKHIIETETIDSDAIVQLFILNDNFSSKYIEYFLLYNIGIKQGRLEELKTKESYQYVKKRMIN